MNCIVIGNRDMNNKMLKRATLLFLIVGFSALNVYSSYDARAIVEVKDINKAEKQIERLELDEKNLKTLLGQNQTQVSTTKNLIIKTESEIKRKEAELENLNNQVVLYKKILETYLQEMYSNNQNQLIILTATSGNMSDILGNVDNMISVKEKTLSMLDQIRQTKSKIEDVKEVLAEKVDDHEKLLSIKISEQSEIKEDIQDTQKTLSQLRSKLDKMRSEYSARLGKAVSTDDILKAAGFAAKATGMNKSFLLGVLIQESNKGQSTGSCTYDEVASGAKAAYKSGKLSKKSYETMLYRKEIFEGIIKELGYKESKVKVSCNPKNYSGTGGAMGVPQFMSDTWRGWEKRIASATGHSTPDPWNLVDGVTAMALKLSNDGAIQKTRFAEAKSYCIYLAGGNWGYYCYGTDKYKKSYEDVNCWGASIKNYGEKVLCLKDNYEKYY